MKLGKWQTPDKSVHILKTENLLCVLENTIVSLHNNTTKMFLEIESVKIDLETALNSSTVCSTPLSSCGMLRLGMQELKYQDSYGFQDVSTWI